MVVRARPRRTDKKRVRKEAAPHMDEQNVTDAIVFTATRSLDANALFLDSMATQMPFVGCG